MKSIREVRKRIDGRDQTGDEDEGHGGKVDGGRAGNELRQSIVE